MQSRLPSTGDIEAFARIAEGFSLVAAAKELNISASAVSRRILGLEAVLGTALVERRGTRLALTSAGAIYAKQLSPIIAALHHASHLARQPQHDRMLRIASGPSLYANWISPRLGSFLEAWPDATVELLTHDMRDVANPDIRIRSGLTTDVLPGENRLLDYQVTPFCRQELLDRNAIVLPSDLMRAPLIEHVRSSDAWARWFKAAGVADYGSAQRVVVDSSFLMYESALNGIGAATLPQIYAPVHSDKGLIVPFPNISTYLGSAFIAMAGSRQRPIVRAFRDWIMAEVGA